MTRVVTRNETIATIRKALKRRSGKTWSVTGGRGTAYGWITITSPPARRVEFDYMAADDRETLTGLLGLPCTVHRQGASIPSSNQYYAEYIDRAEGRTPSVVGTQYWD